jgi:hypothetical protein
VKDAGFFSESGGTLKPGKGEKQMGEFGSNYYELLR